MKCRGREARESSSQIFLCFKFAKQEFFSYARPLLCFNFLEMLNFTSSSFFTFVLFVCFSVGGRDSLKLELKGFIC